MSLSYLMRQKPGRDHTPQEMPVLQRYKQRLFSTGRQPRATVKRNMLTDIERLLRHGGHRERAEALHLTGLACHRFPELLEVGHGGHTYTIAA